MEDNTDGESLSVISSTSCVGAVLVDGGAPDGVGAVLVDGGSLGSCVGAVLVDGGAPDGSSLTDGSKNFCAPVEQNRNYPARQERRTSVGAVGAGRAAAPAAAPAAAALQETSITTSKQLGAAISPSNEHLARECSAALQLEPRPGAAPSAPEQLEDGAKLRAEALATVEDNTDAEEAVEDNTDAEEPLRSEEGAVEEITDAETTTLPSSLHPKSRNKTSGEMGFEGLEPHLPRSPVPQLRLQNRRRSRLFWGRRRDAMLEGAHSGAEEDDFFAQGSTRLSAASGAQDDVQLSSGSRRQMIPASSGGPLNTSTGERTRDAVRRREGIEFALLGGAIDGYYGFGLGGDAAVAKEKQVAVAKDQAAFAVLKELEEEVRADERRGGNTMEKKRVLSVRRYLQARWTVSDGFDRVLTELRFRRENLEARHPSGHARMRYLIGHTGSDSSPQKSLG